MRTDCFLVGTQPRAGTPDRVVPGPQQQKRGTEVEDGPVNLGPSDAAWQTAAALPAGHRAAVVRKSPASRGLPTRAISDQSSRCQRVLAPRVAWGPWSQRPPDPASRRCSQASEPVEDDGNEPTTLQGRGAASRPTPRTSEVVRVAGWSTPRSPATSEQLTGRPGTYIRSRRGPARTA